MCLHSIAGRAEYLFAEGGIISIKNNALDVMGLYLEKDSMSVDRCLSDLNRDRDNDAGGDTDLIVSCFRTSDNGGPR